MKVSFTGDQKVVSRCHLKTFRFNRPSIFRVELDRILRIFLLTNTIHKIRDFYTVFNEFI